MTNTKHTPGPWHYTPTKTYDVTHVVRDDGGFGIAVVNSMMASGNAHLIAAAPDLLEALEALRRWMGPCGLDPEIDDAMSAADAAIAKARGEG